MKHETLPTEPPELVALYERRQTYIDRIGHLASAAAILHREQDRTLTDLININDAIRSFDGTGAM